MSFSTASGPRAEDGSTLVELLVAISIGMIVLVGILNVVDASSRSSNRTTARVQANQAGRPALSRIIDQLHSSCVGPGAAPVLAGSDGSTISFLHATGSAVTPVPAKRTFALSSGTLIDSVYANTGGASPSWTFAASPSSTFQVATGVGLASLGSPSSTVPLFRYFAYDAGGQLSSTPLPTPLSAADALKVVSVDVAFSVTPTKTTPNPDAGAPVSLSDTALLRFSPAGSPAAGNLPCL